MGEEDLNPEFTRCVEKGKIVTFAKGPSLVSKELDSANDDLIASKDSLARGNYKWATIQAYYSMFHMARALIYAKKYREKSHYCLVVALEHLYVERGVLEKGLVESLVIGKEMRESADYRSSFSKEGGENLIRAAEDFRDSVGKLLKK
ncbi:MAG: HEPN domain-containing protein [Deltaproteobacteria bacterium]|nr:HEPN domain-containing protein [Deltaproteobacteria bacterium]